MTVTPSVSKIFVTEVTLERSGGTTVTFAPHTTTVYEFTLAQAGDDPASRADIGIGTDDIALKGRNLTLTVHSLGAKDTPGGTAMLEDGSGRVLASAPIPAIAAPTDLAPRTATVRLALPAGASPGSLRVRIALTGDAKAVTVRNNSLPLAK